MFFKWKKNVYSTLRNLCALKEIRFPKPNISSPTITSSSSSSVSTASPSLHSMSASSTTSEVATDIRPLLDEGPSTPLATFAPLATLERGGHRRRRRGGWSTSEGLLGAGGVEIFAAGDPGWDEGLVSILFLHEVLKNVFWRGQAREQKRWFLDIFSNKTQTYTYTQRNWSLMNKGKKEQRDWLGEANQADGLGRRTTTKELAGKEGQLHFNHAQLQRYLVSLNVSVKINFRYKTTAICGKIFYIFDKLIRRKALKFWTYFNVNF